MYDWRVNVCVFFCTYIPTGVLFIRVFCLHARCLFVMTYFPPPRHFEGNCSFLRPSMRTSVCIHMHLQISLSLYMDVYTCIQTVMARHDVCVCGGILSAFFLSILLFLFVSSSFSSRLLSSLHVLPGLFLPLLLPLFILPPSFMAKSTFSILGRKEVPPRASLLSSPTVRIFQPSGERV